jgi:peptidoglycan/LPS O-acetylase OafA/YrhL
MRLSGLSGSSSPSLVSIQALRGIAALLVFADHAVNHLVLVKIAAFKHFLAGPFGVDLFFVISGFVMVYSSERLFGQPGAPTKFFARRLARIVPLYWAATSIFVWFVVPYASTEAVLGSFFFSPRVPSETPLLFVGWTLIYEMFFYAVFAIALLAKRRLIVVTGACTFLVLFTVFGPEFSSAGFFHPPASDSIAYFTNPIIIEFVFGMVIALVYRAGVRLSIQTTIGLIGFAAAWYMAAVPSVPRQFSCGIAAALIVAGMSLSSMPSPKSSPLVGTVIFLGDISYALYLTHILSFALVAWIVTELAINPLDHVWPYVGAMLAGGLLIASTTHLMFEKPVTKILQKWIHDRPLMPTTSALTATTPTLAK